MYIFFCFLIKIRVMMRWCDTIQSKLTYNLYACFSTFQRDFWWFLSFFFPSVLLIRRLFFCFNLNGIFRCRCCCCFFLLLMFFFFINGNNGLVWPMRMCMLWYLWSMVIAQFCPLHVHFKSIFNTIQSRVVRLLEVLYILNVTFVCFIYSHHFRFQFNLGEYHTCVSPLSFSDVR